MAHADDKREETLALLKANGGNVSRTAREAEVPAQTIRHWRDRPLTKSGEEKRGSLADKLEEIVWAAAGAIPEKLKDARLAETATAMGIALDKMRLLRSEPTSINETRGELAADERARSIAAELRGLSEAEMVAKILSLPEDAQERLYRLTCLPSIEPRSYSPHSPTPKQAEFLALTAREALYGGAAGGGKSDSLLMAALQYVHVPGYAALLFRRTYKDLSLPGALMDRAHEWLRGTDAHWNDVKKTWTFPSTATVTFGHLDSENEKYSYQGAEFNFIGFDELTQYSETAYRYLLSRLRRTTGSEVPSRMRAASNPGGIGHEWVRARFVDPGDPERPFIPAKLEDNPYLDLVDYEASLSLLDPVTRAQLRSGDWDVLPEGRLFKREWFLPIIEPRDLPPFVQTLRFWDLAATEPKPGHDPDWTAGVKVGRTSEGLFVVLDVQRTRERPQGVEALILRTAEEDGTAVRIWMEQEPGSSGVSVIDYYTRKVLTGYTFRGLRTTGPKEVRAGPVSSQAEAGNVKLLRGAWNGEFLDEVGSFPTVGIHDDQVDALSGAMERLAAKRPTQVYVL